MVFRGHHGDHHHQNYLATLLVVGSVDGHHLTLFFVSGQRQRWLMMYILTYHQEATAVRKLDPHRGSNLFYLKDSSDWHVRKTCLQNITSYEKYQQMLTSTYHLLIQQHTTVFMYKYLLFLLRYMRFEKACSWRLWGLCMSRQVVVQHFCWYFS